MTKSPNDGRALEKPILEALLAGLPLIYLVTDEEDRFFNDLNQIVQDTRKTTFVFNQALGMVPLETILKDWETMEHKQGEGVNPHASIVKVIQAKRSDVPSYYYFLDAPRLLEDGFFVRRLLNFVQQVNNNTSAMKTVVLVGHRPVVPAPLAPYMEVVYHNRPDDKTLQQTVNSMKEKLGINVTAGVAPFRGLTVYETRRAMELHTAQDKNAPMTPHDVWTYKRSKLAGGGLVTPIDVSNFDFDQVGGNDKFKEWARKVKHCWTPEGQKFGLTPPRGVLALGVWGCGKSLSVKAMGKAWDLPVLQLELGKLRSSGVGESEGNVYRMIRAVEAQAPCILWVDEAEKSFAGMGSSDKSDSGTLARMVGILSTWVQESKAQVCLAMTANNISSLPVEFTNRMDERFFFDLANEDERISILKIHLKKIGVDSSKFNLANLAEAARLLVGREIEQAIKAAMIDSFAAGAKTLDEAILAKVLRTKPRIVNTMKDEIADVLDWVGYDEEAQDGIRAKLASGRKPESFSLVKGDLAQQKTPWKRYLPLSLLPQTPSTLSWYGGLWRVDPR